MTLNDQQKLSNHICRLLKVPEITFPIGRTAKGNLGIVFSEKNKGFDLMLDSVPLSTNSILEDENNIELKAMVEKYFFENKEVVMFTRSQGFEPSVPVEAPKKKGGRPKGSKNKKHGHNTTKETS